MSGFDLRALYKQAFGAQVRLTANDLAIDEGKRFGKGSFTVPKEDNIKDLVYRGVYQGVTSALGVPIFMPVMLENKWLPNEPLVSVGRDRKYTRTEIPGHDGTIKENMGLGDWEIRIRGIATNDYLDLYPSQEVKAIKKLCDLPKSLSIKGPLFDYLNIHKVIITRCSFPELEGVQNAQPYELFCLSDEDSDYVTRKGKETAKNNGKIIV